MYAVMGATAQTGSIVLDTLRARGKSVRAITSDRARAAQLHARGIEVAVADARDADALAAAFAGAAAAYVMLPPYVRADDVLAAGRTAAAAIADAVRCAGVGHVVALSSCGAHLGEGTGIVRMLHEFERALLRVDARLTRVRPTYYLENWRDLVPVALETGVLPSVRVPLEHATDMVSARDVGALAAELLLAGERAPALVELRGPREYSPEDLARALGDALGCDVRAVATSIDEFVAALLAQGVGRSYAVQLGELERAINAGGVPFERPAHELRRGATTFEALAEAFAAHARAGGARASA